MSSAPVGSVGDRRGSLSRHRQPPTVNTSFSERTSNDPARPGINSIAGLDRARLESPDDRELTPRRWREIAEFIDTHLGMPLTIVDLASRVGLSPSHFSRAFSAILKVTPHCYLMSRRVSKAQELLAFSNMPVADIALVAGFADQSHLSRRFREQVGLTPSSFRRRHRYLDSVRRA